MAKAFDVQVSGLDDIKRALGELPKAFATPVLDAALRGAAKVVLDEARRLAPKRGQGKGHATGRMAKSLVLRKPGRRLKKGSAHLVLTAKDGEHRLLHLVEFGTGPRKTKTGANRGWAPAQPFMRPALDAKAEAFIDTFGAAAKKKLDETVKKLAAGYKPPSRSRSARSRSRRAK